MNTLNRQSLVLISFGIALVSMTQLMGCSGDDQKSEAVQEAPKTESSAGSSGSSSSGSTNTTSDTTASSSPSSCVWKQVNKNGPYYSTTGNSIYLCNSPAISGMSQSIVYIGFYTDDSISWRDSLSDSQDRILTPVTDANCTVNAFQGSNGRMDYYNVIKDSNGDLKSLTIHNWMITLNRTRDYTCTKISSYMAP